MNKILFSLFLLIIVIPLSSHVVSAHTLGTDESVGAVLHIDPDDDPIIGEPSTIYFEFKSQSDSLSPQTCDCTVAISENGKELFSQKLFTDTNTNPIVQYTFPEKNQYKITVSGKPTGEADFKPFSISYDVRVSKDATPTQKPNWFVAHLSTVVIGVGVALSIIYFVLQSLRGKRKKTSKE